MISRNTMIKALFASSVILGGCTPDLDQLEKTTPQEGDAFTIALTNDYKTLAEEDKQEGSYIQAEQFARKGLGAAGGEMVQPIDPIKTDVPPEYLQELSNGRAVLAGLFSQRIDLKLPNEMAAAQVNFDCWVSETANNDLDSAQKCKANFMDDLSQIHAALHVAQPELYMAFFNSESTQIDAAGIQALEASAQSFLNSGKKQILVLGYTDLVGSDAHNIHLSQLRANAGKQVLIRCGVPADAILALGQGESNPLINTTTSNRENRRIEVIIR